MDFKKRCQNCASLIEVNKEWCCDECFGQPCAEVDDCPEGIEVKEVAEMDSIKTKHYEQSDEPKKRKAPARKVDNDKIELINMLWAVVECVDPNGEIVKAEREIDFKYNGSSYSLTLTKHRDKKK